MLVQLEHDECESGGQVCGRVVLSAKEAEGTDSVHFIQRGQEFSLIYYRDEEKRSLAAAQAHVFYEKSYDYRVERHQLDKGRDFVIPFTLPLPAALPSTALLHLTTSENFMRIQYKLQVFRTGSDSDNTVTFQTMEKNNNSSGGGGGGGGGPIFGEDQSSNAQTLGTSANNSCRIRNFEPIPKDERLLGLYHHHTRSSPDATPLLIRAPGWNPQQATTHLHVQVAERVQMVRSAFCGLYDYTTVTFRLLTQPPTLHAAPGRDIRLLLTDPENFLRSWIDTRTTFVLDGKVTQTIQWHTSRRFVAYPIHRTWDLPEVTFDVEPLTEETKDGIFDEHILLDRAITFPEEPNETFEGIMLSVKSEFMLGLRFVNPLGKKLTTGATPTMPLQVRGGGGLSLVTKEAKV